MLLSMPVKFLNGGLHHTRDINRGAAKQLESLAKATESDGKNQTSGECPVGLFVERCGRKMMLRKKEAPLA
jgi:hypothetical protein